jgi:hypothetical protein
MFLGGGREQIFLPTIRAKPLAFGNGLPKWFERLPVKTT